MQLSDNGLKAVMEVGRWVVAICAVGTFWIQSHYQHEERVVVDKAASEANIKAIDKQTTEFKAALEQRRPLVFGDAK